MNNKMLEFMKYFYPTDEIRNFMCNDLYQELNEIIPKTKCFCCDNVVAKTREENYMFVKTHIVNFVLTNENYKNELEKLYKGRDFDDVVNDIIIGYVFYVVNTNEKNKGENIFKSKKSICYSIGPNILDVL